jgi:hypothetical protein
VCSGAGAVLQRHACACVQVKLEAEMATAAQLPDALDQVPLDDAHARSDACWHFCSDERAQVSEATDRCEQLREALTKCEGRLGAALEQVNE